MRVNEQSSGLLRLNAQAVGLAVVLTIVVGVALVTVKPRSSDAEGVAGAEVIGAALVSLDEHALPRVESYRHPQGWPMLGQLASPEFVVGMFASPEGLRYAVWASNGEVLGHDLTGRDLSERFPSLDLDSLYLDPVPRGEGAELPALMIADPLSY